MSTTSEIPKDTKERSDRIRELLNSPLSSSSVAKKICKSRPRNALLGVVFHACARFEQGLPLSDLEESILNRLGKILSDEELRENGLIYQAMAQANRTEMFPDEIASLPLESSYTEKEFGEYLRTIIVPELLLQPNIRIVDPKKVASGEIPNPEEDESFLMAMREYGHGSIAYYSPPTDLEARSTMSVKLTLDRFKCTDESNEWSPSDEIFWAIASSSDLGYKNDYRSQVFDNVDAGDTIKFDTGAVLFQGSLDKALMYNIECWEEDLGTGYEKIADVMYDIADRCLETCQTLSDSHETELAMGVAALGSIVSSVLGAVFGSFENDLVKSREWAWNQEALREFIREGEHY